MLKPWFDYFLRNWKETHAAPLKIDSEIASCQIQADPGAVQVILKNLLENTIRHGGSAKLPSVRITTETRDGWIVLRYRDDGQGFSGDARKLGTLFHKGEGSPGAGVGLYLVTVLMQRMGGRAEFAAGPQLETSLWFRAGGGASG